MAIPKISRANVLSAIKYIRKKGIPPRRRSTRYCLVHDGRRYPPKYVVSLAVKNVTGRALDPREFGGGVETNSLLRRLGFSVVSFKRGDADTGRRPANYGEMKRKMKGGNHKSFDSGKTASRAPLIGRVVVRGRSGDPIKGEAILLDVLTKRWPKGLRLKFLITPGGFVVGDFPTSWLGGIGWKSKSTDLKELIKHAKPTLERTITNRVLKAAAGKVDVLTIGIDLDSDERQEHAELVAIYEFAGRRVFAAERTTHPSIGPASGCRDRGWQCRHPWCCRREQVDGVELLYLLSDMALPERHIDYSRLHVGVTHCLHDGKRICPAIAIWEPKDCRSP